MRIVRIFAELQQFLCLHFVFRHINSNKISSAWKLSFNMAAKPEVGWKSGTHCTPRWTLCSLFTTWHKSLWYIHWNRLRSRLSQLLRFILFIFSIHHQRQWSEWIERLCYTVNPMVCYASYRKYSMRETLELNYALTLRLSSFKLNGWTATSTFVWLSWLGTSNPSLCWSWEGFIRRHITITCT